MKLPILQQHFFSLSFTRFTLIPMVLLAILASGCQTLSMTPETHLTVWTGQAESVENHEFTMTKDQAIVGNLARVNTNENDTLSDLARHFGLGFTDITIANSDLDPWVVPANQSVLLPLEFILPEAPRKGLVLNLANMRLFYYPQNQDKVITYPVGIGRDGWSTPLGTTKIIAKKANPAWTVPASILREHQQMGSPLPKVVPSGPDNPLGYYAMPLGFTGYLIHGTNKPYGIGMQISHGCVQLYPEDVEELFHQVDVDTPVRIVHQPYLVAWKQDMLYLEAHQPLDKWSKQDKKLQKEVRKKLEKLASKNNVSVDWLRVDATINQANGIPTPVLQNAMDLATITADAIQVQRPEQLYGQPVVNKLTANDWSIVTESFDNEIDAQKLAAMLNHQGPQIPARKIEKNGVYQVVAGPFTNKKETRIVANRIKSNFDLNATPIKPNTK